MPKVSWPVVVLSSNDRFLHVCRDAAGLREHIAADLAGGLAPLSGRHTALEFFGVDGQRLQPTVGPHWTVDGFAPAGQRVAERDLLVRMESALRTAERIDRRHTVGALVAEGLPEAEARLVAGRDRRRVPRTQGSVADQAEQILALLDEEVADTAVALNRGGWLHTAWHAAFG
ncbi:hypothetical protein AB0M54_34490 [Actinoplanes sp. NPDC051470]|uniref:hypothetical protein n=1 Tax=unclassified Actinoplanes TaxID=2626549 RepID=UPI0034271890